jgi:hypothetical protein
MVIEDGVVCWKINDVLVKNGEHSADTFESSEILADPVACASLQNDRFTSECRVELGARIV